jgi:hypothetical protein
MKRNSILVCLTIVVLALTATPASANISGAIYTTNVACGGVNVNNFPSKDDVYLNGGPQGGGSGLPNGNYYVQVTNPNGDVVLGKTLTASVHVAGGAFVQCYRLVEILYSGSSSFAALGFDDSPNSSGVYKVWVSQNAAFPSNESKTDNFKVAPAVVNGTLEVTKFYDANANGVKDGSEVNLADWRIFISDGVQTLVRYTPVSLQLAPGAYDVSEDMPQQPNWMRTFPATQPVTANVSAGNTTSVAFGNVCLGPGGGKTLGFWSNKNGQSYFGPADLALLVSLNLRTASGDHFNPATYAEFRSWILSATATNMSYMLSAQLAAMALNVENAFVSGTAIVYAPGVDTDSDFVTINALMAAANAALGANGLVLSGDADRDYQEALKNALDRANNNLNFVQAAACTYTFADLP